MRLSELNPEWEEKSPNDPSLNVDRYIYFQCPTFPKENHCGGLMLPVTQNKQGPGTQGGGWQWNGEEDFEKVTLSPSIWHHCKSDPHFFITDGDVRLV